MEWIRKRDGLTNNTAYEHVHNDGSRRGSTITSRERHGGRHPNNSTLGRGEQADEWRYADDGRLLYSAEYLRSLGYDVASEEDEREDKQRRSNTDAPSGSGFAWSPCDG